MSRSVVIGCAVVAALAAGSPAVAAKQVCHQITDGKGDGHPSNLSIATSNALDIVGGDIATGKKSIVGVLRLASTDASDPMSAFGETWSLNFTVQNKTYNFRRTRVAGTTEEYRYAFNGSSVELTSHSETATEIKWVIPRSAVEALKKPKAVFESISATSSWFVTNADAAAAKTGTRYVDKTPSCLKPA
jgi:hypothetical protein